MAHAVLTFTDVSYSSNSLSFSVSGDMSGYAPPAQQLLFTILYEGDMWAGPAALTPNTWNQKVFTNLSLTNQGNTGYYAAGAVGYTFSQYSAPLNTGTVTNSLVRVTFAEARLNPSAVNPIVTFAWGGVNGYTVLDTVNLGASTYSVGGTVSGLTGTVILQNNAGDDLSLSSNGSFIFATEMADSSAYAVTVSTQPTGQTCTVTNGSGTIAAADVTDVVVTCVTDVIPTYSVGGTVSGLTGTVILQNNAADDLSLSSNGSFTFATELADSSAYAVTISTQPTGQTCTVTNGSGTIAAADVTDVGVACVNDTVPPVTPPATPEPVPTMSEWTLIILSVLFGLIVFANRRRLF
jgi:hypothetical protein